MPNRASIWARAYRSVWVGRLKGLRSGALGTFEIRNGKRIDTTLETIAERKEELAELDTLIALDAMDSV